jgi:hypothetical protein
MRRLGHEAYSCDLEECSGGHPEWHIRADAIPILGGHCTVRTTDGQEHRIPDRWDMLIAHPPCTDIANSGARWFPEKQKDFRQQKACVFFMRFILANCDRIAVENPVGIMSTVYRKPDQIIQPWQFALDDSENTVKTTCLWLKGLPMLEPVHEEQPEIEYVDIVMKDGRRTRQTKWYYETRCHGPKHRGTLASKTFPGIARAMAEQWAGEAERSPDDL